MNYKYRKLIILFGFLFFPIGVWLNNLFNRLNTFPPFLVVNLACLIIWAVISFLIKSEKISDTSILLHMHAVPAIFLIFTVYQEFVTASFLTSIGRITQLYYLPLSWLTLPLPKNSLSLNYLSSFLTLISFCYIGIKCKILFTNYKEISNY